ncbi:glycosyltransferase family A protein [Acinetobacter baumannii]|uniref:glycosyltransferase family 2 protein n=1 Tax=Acinetobacter baumannii TaxID=470 RepID=UPI000D65C434|nr:glycosyltransferase family A protein [Acinetobacter baumannii]MDN8175559.1 glycosyltransferase family A protein [Acinetobacter baumannii]HEE5839790.1 glycosyltransferase family 2 protein [Acinetobacter baumannii]
MILLSVIIPFFNTFSRSEKVLKRVRDSLQQYSDVEFILVDDGSKDDTFIQLRQYFQIDECSVLLKIITQENKGPGGARNTGLAVAQGEYIWFVDSDDDFYLDLIYPDLIVKNDFDFIDYNYIENGQTKNSMEIDLGVYSLGQVDLYQNLGRIWTKIFKRDFFVQNLLKYPEKCIYEDNYFVYAMPYFIKKFKKSEKIAYFYEVEVLSVTRETGISIRFYDRLLTSYEGLNFLNNHNAWVKNKSAQQRFKEIFLYNTAKKVLLNMNIERLKIIFYIFCTYNFLENKYIISSGATSNRKNIFIDFIRLFFPSKNYMPYFKTLNKKVWHIDE